MTRIIAGSERGRRLQVPDGTVTRPTSERAREGLFSSLLSLLDLDGARVLDLYAGSGALGLEALSRGAGSATLVEADPKAVRVCEANAAVVGLPGAHVVHSPVAQFLAHGAEPRYDLVLLDPPYDLDVAPALEALVPWLAPEAVVVVERRRRGPALVWPGGLEAVRERKYGDAVLWYAVHAAGAAAR
ncbi:MAG: rRNA ((966)-N(2))-methyltransferase RsmD [Frankiales bacterium]|nr:rRNA ((966)-N(2))-methyltransferase RsmD [Frankiales bacterium]